MKKVIKYFVVLVLLLTSTSASSVLPIDEGEANRVRVIVTICETLSYGCNVVRVSYFGNVTHHWEAHVMPGITQYIFPETIGVGATVGSLVANVRGCDVSLSPLGTGVLAPFPRVVHLVVSNVVKIE